MQVSGRSGDFRGPLPGSEPRAEVDAHGLVPLGATDELLQNGLAVSVHLSLFVHLYTCSSFRYFVGSHRSHVQIIADRALQDFRQAMTLTQSIP